MRSLNIITLLTAMTFLASQASLFGARATPKPTSQVTPTNVPQTAVIVDTSGMSYEVSTLEASYGGGPEGGFRKQSLDLTLTVDEDRIVITEKLSIAFASVRTVSFWTDDVPAAMKEAFQQEKPIRVEMRDGSVLFLSGRFLVELDPTGKQRRAVKVRDLGIEAAAQDGSALFLMGFGGRGRTRSGKEGTFWIDIGETRKIEFQSGR